MLFFFFSIYSHETRNNATMVDIAFMDLLMAHANSNSYVRFQLRIS